MYSLERTTDFVEWFNEQSDKTQSLIIARFSRIQLAGHFGVVKPVGDGVYELKWKSGLRVYFGYLAKTNILVLIGGNKNGQNQDIKKAKKILG